MALDREKSSFTRQAGTGNQTISLVDSGLTPKAIILWGTNQVAEGFEDDVSNFIGAATGPAAERAYGYWVDDANTAILTATRAVADRCIVIIKDESSTISGDAELVSFGAGEFVVNWVTNDGTQNLINYMVIGGDDVTGALVDDVDVPGATGQFTETGIGFTPKFLFIFGSTKVNAYPTNSNKNEKNWCGMATSSSARGCVGFTMKGEVGAANKAASHLSTTRVIIAVKSPTQLESEVDFVSFASGEFTLDQIVAKNAHKAAYLVLGGTADFEVEVGADTQRTTVGTKQTPTGFEPEGLMLLTGSNTGGGSAEGIIIGGGADGTRQGVSGSLIKDNPSTDTKADSFFLTTKVIRMVTPGEPPTTDAEANMDSFDATPGFTLDWTIADGTARQFLYWVMRGVSGAAPQTLTPAPVVATFAVPAPTVVIGGITMAPAPAVATFVIPAPTLLKTKTLTPAAVVASFVVPAPIVVVGGATLTPAAVVAPWAVPDPTVIVGALTLTPASVVATWVVPAVTILAGQTLAPAPVVANWVVPVPTVVAGGVTVAPAAVAANWAVPAPTVVVGGVTMAPASVSANWVVPAVTILAGQNLTPGPVIANWVVPDPTIAAGGVTMTPGATVATWVVPAPTVQVGDLTLTPAATVANWVVPAATMLAGRTISPAPVVASWVVPAPILVAGALTLTPGATVASWTVPAPAVTVGGVTVTPAAVGASWVVPAVTLVAVKTLLPAAVTAAWGVGAPALVLATLTLTPGAAVATWVVPAHDIVIPAVLFGVGKFDEPDRGTAGFVEPDRGTSTFTEPGPE